MTANLTANFYMLGKLKLDGLTKWGEIHAALRYNYSHVKGYSHNDLRELLTTWHESLNVDTALVKMCDHLLQAKVHRYRCQMMCLKQLDKQMKAIEAEMFTIIPKKHQCVEQLSQAQVLPHVRKQIGQRIRDVAPYKVKCGHLT